jgi:hypothetical protein
VTKRQQNRISPRTEFWVKFGGITVFCAMLFASGWLNYGAKQPLLVIGVTLAFYVVAILGLCTSYIGAVPDTIGRVAFIAIVLAIFDARPRRIGAERNEQAAEANP